MLISRRFRLSTLAWLVFLSAPAIGQVPNPDLVLSVTDAFGPSGSVQTTTIEFSHTYPLPVVGWTLGVCHDSTVLDVVSATSGSTTQTIDGGSPPDFEIINVILEGTEPPGTSSGVNQGVVISFLGGASLPIGSGYELLRIDYLLEGPIGAVTEVEFCDDTAAGVGVVETLISCICSFPPTPVTEPGTIFIEDPSTFERGDCNNDGTFNIADVVWGLSYMFGDGAAPVCLDSCDTDDDGSLGVADAVWSIAWFYTPGWPPILPPFGSCGDDPTVDGLDCDDSFVCP